MSYRLWIVFLLILFTPGAARADWLFTPVLGPTFGADTIGREHVAFGATVGWREAESFGFELDAFLSPKLLRRDLRRSADLQWVGPGPHGDGQHHPSPVPRCDC